uniref:Putative udp-glucuronosyltransferase n=1 Tax=Corethrella appendiculata TaxID=1370023 RepID=U5EUX0_9DIPT
MNRINFFRIFLLLLTIFKPLNGANILCLFNVPSPSHHIWNTAIVKGLAAKGHNLTIVSPDIEVNKPANVNYIHLEKVYSSLYNATEEAEAMKIADFVNIEGIDLIKEFYVFQAKACEGQFKSKGFDIINDYPDNFNFDLVLYDFTCGPCLIGLMHKFKYPTLVSISAFSNPSYTTNLIGGHKYPAYIPYYSLSYDTNMNFWQRLYNTFLYVFDNLYRNYYASKEIEILTQKGFGYKDMPSVYDIEKKTNLMLLNTDVSHDYPEPITPNTIPVAGLHIKEPKVLPQDIKTFIESGKKGSVLFSLGTNIRSDQLSKENLEIIIQALKQLPEYNFLWKFESDISGLPKNVQVRAWLPQSDILAYKPYIKAFITHSGLLSTQESIWRGVPMIAIPFFADQIRNAQKSVLNGIAEKVNFRTISVEALRDTIRNVIENPNYTKNIQRMSYNFQDQPSKPLDRAIWWIEWALRHPDATHIQSPVLKLGFFRANSYDVLLFVLCIALYICTKFYNLVHHFVVKKPKPKPKHLHHKKQE